MTLLDKLGSFFSGRHSPAALCREAARLRVSGNVAQALRCYESALKRDPAFSDALHGAGVIALEQGRIQDAVPLLESAAQVRCDDIQLQYDLGEAYRLSSAWEAAAKSFGAVLGKQPDIRAAQLGLAESLLRLGRHGEAAGLSLQALASEPDDPRALALGGELALHRGDAAGAERHVCAVLRHAPSDRAATLLLARALLAQARYDEGVAALRPLLADRADEDAHGLLVELLAGRVRRDEAPGDGDGSDYGVVGADSADPGEETAFRGAPAIAERALISVIICSANKQKYDAVLRHYTGLLQSERFEIIGIHDATSLCEGYNRGARQAAGDHIVFSHDDIEVLTPDFASRLKRHLSHHDVVGACGASRLVLGHWMAAGWPHLQGLVAHHYPAQHEQAGWYRVLVLDTAAEDSTGQLQCLDGMFMAARREVVERCRFDEETFDGFHLYDLDFTYSAYLAGYDVAAFRDITMVHYTYGQSAGYEEEFTRYRLMFEAKYRADIVPIRSDSRRFLPALFRSKQGIRTFCAQLLDERRRSSG